MKNPEYRLVRKTETSPDRTDYHFLVCQVFYDHDGHIKLIDTADCVRGRSPESAQTKYTAMANAFFEPVIDFNTLEELTELYA